jgi:hypothetical protein
MSRNLARVAAVLLAAALFSVAVSACRGGTAATSATSAEADYAGLWVNPEVNNEIWLHATAEGDKVTLRWEREWSQPVTQQATVQADGSLKAAAVAPDAAGSSDGEVAYTGRLTDDGGLDMATTTHVTGVDAPIPVTLHFVRGSQAKYTVFAARMNRNLEAQRVSDAWGQALNTIVDGIRAWQDEHGHDKAPPANAVRPGGAVDKALEADGKAWPRLSDGTLLLPGRDRGEYVYRPLPHGYRLGGLAPDRQGPTVFGQDW